MFVAILLPPVQNQKDRMKGYWWVMSIKLCDYSRNFCMIQYENEYHTVNGTFIFSKFQSQKGVKLPLQLFGEN